MKKPTQLLRNWGTLAMLSVSLVACEKDSDRTPQTITDVIVGNPNYTILRDAVTRANLGDALRTTQNLTVFAPSNQAFANAGLSAAAVAALPVATLTSILTYHVVPAEVRSGQVAQGSSSAPTLLQGNSLYLSNNSRGIAVNGRAKVDNPNLIADNGVIHGIDNVILPANGNIVEAVVANPNLSLLRDAVIKCNLQGVLSGAGPFTVFAPTNAAFEAIGFNAAAIANASGATLQTLTNVLLYHVVASRAFSSDFVGTVNVPTAYGGRTVAVTDGRFVKGNGTTASANITAANSLHTNGVVHIIDRVLLP